MSRPPLTTWALIGQLVCLPVLVAASPVRKLPQRPNPHFLHDVYPARAGLLENGSPCELGERVRWIAMSPQLPNYAPSVGASASMEARLAVVHDLHERLFWEKDSSLLQRALQRWARRPTRFAREAAVRAAATWSTSACCSPGPLIA